MYMCRFVRVIDTEMKNLKIAGKGLAALSDARKELEGKRNFIQVISTTRCVPDQRTRRRE